METSWEIFSGCNHYEWVAHPIWIQLAKVLIGEAKCWFHGTTMGYRLYTHEWPTDSDDSAWLEAGMLNHRSMITGADGCRIFIGQGQFGVADCILVCSMLNCPGVLMVKPPGWQVAGNHSGTRASPKVVMFIHMYTSVLDLRMIFHIVLPNPPPQQPPKRSKSQSIQNYQPWMTNHHLYTPEIQYSIFCWKVRSFFWVVSFNTCQSGFGAVRLTSTYLVI